MRVIHSLEIRDEAQVGAARRAVHRFAAPLGFNDTELAEIDIVVQEIGTNAARYAAGEGWLHFAVPLGKAPGIELFYWDKGPGIYDVDRAVRDGVSTSSSLGAGLGAIRRLMDEFDLYSTVCERAARLSLQAMRRTTHGTALLCRKWVAAAHQPLHAPDFVASTEEVVKRLGIWSRPARGEDANGDAYYIWQRDDLMLLAAIDGLGHGRGAHEAARAALSILEQWAGEPLDELFFAAHDALRATRGAVMSVIVLDETGETFQYAGVGNIEVRVFNAPEPIHVVPNNGTLGARLEKVRVWSHKWSRGGTVVMATDGISAAWDLSAYPSLLTKNPQLLAGILLRDFGRDSDDATVLVLR